jgi:hypothetical protein
MCRLAAGAPPHRSDLGPEDAPRVTLVGKGVVFDTGGLDIKPASNMLLMKKLFLEIRTDGHGDRRTEPLA